MASPSELCLPRWSTPRTASRPTLGPRVGQVATKFGMALMPWQQAVIDVALELDPVSLLPVYREVGLTVPRQQGKTLLVLATMVHRALGFAQLSKRRQNIIYTAQTGMAARTKFEDDHLPILENSSYKGQYKKRMRNGSEALIWANGSKQAIAATTDTAGHGETLDLGIIDEAFAHVDDILEQAFKPAMLTRADAQLWWLSTAGTAKSLYLLDKVAVGRSLVESGLTEGVAYFEWSAEPGSDPSDPATWRGCMPGLGHTVTEAAVAADQRTMKPNKFRRGYMNIADTESGDEWIIFDEDLWRAAVTDPQPPPEGAACFAIETAEDRSATAIMASWEDGGKRISSLAALRPGTSWAIPWLEDKVPKWRPTATIFDTRSPLLTEALRSDKLTEAVRRGDTLIEHLTSAEFCQAAALYLDGVQGHADDEDRERDPAKYARDLDAARFLRHHGQGELTSAVGLAIKKKTPLSFYFDRSGQGFVLVAAANALLGSVKFAPRTYDPLDNFW